MFTPSSCLSSLVLALTLAGWLSEQSAEPVRNAPSCTYPLAEVPPDASELRVYVNRKHVPNNSRNGWTYSSATNSVVFHGSTCDAIESGRVTKIEIVCARHES